MPMLHSDATTCTFEVLGDPASKGSAKGFVVGSHVNITNDCKAEKPWAQAVHWTARELGPLHPWDGPVGIEITFNMRRPGKLGKRRVGVRAFWGRDLDKLVRSVLDALTGVFYLDDRQITEINTHQYFADFGQPSGAVITVRRLPVEEEDSHA